MSPFSFSISLLTVDACKLIRWILLIYSIHSLVVLMEYLEMVMTGASTSILVTRETVVMIFGNYPLNKLINFYELTIFTGLIISESFENFVCSY